jgi:hypothetical protein
VHDYALTVVSGTAYLAVDKNGLIGKATCHNLKMKAKVRVTIVND